MEVGYVIVVIKRIKPLHATLQPRPRRLQGQDATRAGLEMEMVRGRSSALRAVVKHHHVRIHSKEAMHLGIVFQYALRLVGKSRNSEMHREDGIRIDKYLEPVAETL